MKKLSWVFVGLLSAVVLGLPAHVQAGSMGNGAAQRAAAAAAAGAKAAKDVDFKDIPQAVQDAVAKASGGAKVHHVVQYNSSQYKLHYHVVIGNGNIRQTLVLDDKGSLLLTEDKVDFESLPGPVKTTLGKRTGDGKLLDDVEKASNADKTYYVGTIISQSVIGNDTIIRISEDGKFISEAYEGDFPLAGEKPVPQSARVLRADMKTETVKFDDLPAPVKATISADAKSDPVASVLHLLPGGDVPEAYVVTISKDADTQRKTFVDATGDTLDGAELNPYLQARQGNQPPQQSASTQPSQQAANTQPPQQPANTQPPQQPANTQPPQETPGQSAADKAAEAAQKTKAAADKLRGFFGH